MWLEEGEQGDSGGFIGDLDWIDQVPGLNKRYTIYPDARGGSV